MIHRFVGGIAAVLLLLASCGETAPPQAGPASSPSPVATFPLTITDDDGVEVTIPEEPQRIVTFAPSMTEIVFELGLGDRLVGVSGPFDDYPAAAKDIEEVGGAGDFGVDPTIEKVVSLEPDCAHDPRRRPVEAAAARPRHPGRHPPRGRRSTTC